MSGRVSDTFGGFWDRLTYIFAEAQFLVAGILVSVAIALLWLRPEIPGVPPIVMGWVAAFLLLGPPTFGFFIGFIKWIRTRNMEECYKVNGRQGVLKHFYVEPGLWSEKQTDGPGPYPVNDGDAWAVQEFEYDEEMGQVRVKGVWLEETSDVDLMTSKNHFESIYSKLTESHIALNIMRDSISELGADIQRRLTNRMAEARERGKMMDKKAVKEVFEDFEEEIEGTGPEDLPILEPDEPETGGGEIGAETDDGLPGPSIEAEAEAAAQAATDGGSNE